MQTFQKNDDYIRMFNLKPCWKWKDTLLEWQLRTTQPSTKRLNVR